MTPWSDLSRADKDQFFEKLKNPSIEINGRACDLLIKKVGFDFHLRRLRYFISEKLEFPEYEITPEIEAIFRFFIEGQHLARKRGFILHGNVGTGKTVLMKILFGYAAFYHYIPMPDFIPVYKILSEFRQSGEPAIARIIESKQLIIDDLGTEDFINVFGSRRNLLQEIIFERYDKGPDFRTYYTTNLTLQEIQEFYGSRILSRLTETAFWDETTLTGGDRRLGECRALKPENDKLINYMFQNKIKLAI